MIELHDVTIRMGQFVLDRISLQVEAGQYAVLMGRTGQGKTTILEAVCGLRRISSGRIIVRGEDITEWLPAERAIGYVPQDLALFPMMTVYEHLAFALRLRRVNREQIKLRVAELAEVLGISALLQRKVPGLSGGESQRVALGRALSFRPSVLLLDEPLSALDEASRQEIHTLLRRLKATTGVTALHVTHNLEDAVALADRRLVLDNGHVKEDIN